MEKVTDLRKDQLYSDPSSGVQIIIIGCLGLILQLYWCDLRIICQFLCNVHYRWGFMPHIAWFSYDANTANANNCNRNVLLYYIILGLFKFTNKANAKNLIHLFFCLIFYLSHRLCQAVITVGCPAAPRVKKVAAYCSFLLKDGV